MNHRIAARTGRAALVAGLSVVSCAAMGAGLQSLTVCADPGNMPLSNQKGEGFENKIAQVIGMALGTGVQYYWRPSIERGLMRTTLGEGNCDVWMDMASDTEGAVVLSPLYRSTFVLAYRSDKGISIKSLDDPALKRLSVGVFQVSAMREALSDHGVQANTIVHYLSHNADIVEGNQPSFQVKQVIDGTLDVAAIWGPMAGYYKAVEHAPLIIQPVNRMDDQVPLEFNMSLAVPRGRPDVKAAVEQALKDHREDIRKILIDYGVPLVKCDDCLVSGDIPSHGPYAEPKPDVRIAAVEAKDRARVRAMRMAELKRSLAAGANADEELNDAITADDVARVQYTLSHGAHADSTDGEGMSALTNAVRFGFADISKALLEHHANANSVDRSSWTPLMYAAWDDDTALIELLLAHGASMKAMDNSGLTPLGIAAQNGKAKAAAALVKAGDDVNAPVAKGNYTPLMLASISGSADLVTTLIGHGAKVNAANPGGVTALMIAAANDHPNVADVLLRSGADIEARSQDGRTALDIAHAKNNANMIKMMEDAAQRGSGKSS